MSQKIAVVAGGGKNLGALISQSLAKQGFGVVIHYNSESSAKEAKATADGITKSGGQAWLVQSNLNIVDNIEKLFKTALEKGPVTVAINTVGKVLKKPMEQTTEEEYDAMFAVNSKVAYFFIQKAGKYVQEGGSIVSFATSLLAAFTPFYSTYQGSKSPVDYFTKSAAKELMSRNIMVNSIAPGPMDTPFFYPQESDEAVAFHKSAAAQGRLTKIEDIVPVVDMLVSGQHWINGQTIYANGGYTSK